MSSLTSFVTNTAYVTNLNITPCPRLRWLFRRYVGRSPLYEVITYVGIMDVPELALN